MRYCHYATIIETNCTKHVIWKWHKPTADRPKDGENCKGSRGTFMFCKWVAFSLDNGNSMFSVWMIASIEVWDFTHAVPLPSLRHTHHWSQIVCHGMAHLDPINHLPSSKLRLFHCQYFSRRWGLQIWAPVDLNSTTSMDSMAINEAPNFNDPMRKNATRVQM